MTGGRKIAAAALVGAAGLAVLLVDRMPQPPAVPEARLTAPLREPRVVIHRRARRLELHDGERLVRTYRAAMGSRGEGDKEREGDRTTPLGTFYVCTRNDKSRFHLFLGLSYPAPEDAQRGLDRGWITRREHDLILEAHRGRTCPPWKTALGGEVGIHGGGADRDWTLGCIALSNADVEELWKVLRLGDSVTILP